MRVQGNPKDVVPIMAINDGQSMQYRPPSPSVSSKRSWLVEAWDRCRTVTKRTPTRAIPSTGARIYNEDISLKVAQRAKVTRLNSDIRKHRYAFQLLPVLKREIDAEDEDARFQLAIDREIDIFRKYFCCLGASRSCFGLGHSRQLIGEHGTHLTGNFGCIPLLAVRIDATSQVVFLAWAVVENEISCSGTTA